MITNIWERNDLSWDSSNNQSESFSAKRLRNTNYCGNNLELLLRMVKDVYNTEEEEKRQAFIGEGEFEMSDFFRNYSKG